MKRFVLNTDDASGGAVASDPWPVNLNTSPVNIGFGCVVTGTVDYTVQHTFDNVFDPAYDASTGNWFDHSAVAGATANQDGNYAFPITAIRLVQDSGSGSVALAGIQAGIQ